jgi:hypothetical protein
MYLSTVGASISFSDLLAFRPHPEPWWAVWRAYLSLFVGKGTRLNLGAWARSLRTRIDATSVEEAR